ncbi:MAG: DUF2520 domain-containing protein, partial [Candidatus Dormibacteria bacterium]
MSSARAEKLPSVAVVGAGRAGSALAVALHGAGFPVVAISSRSVAAAATLSAAVGAGQPCSPDTAARRADVTLLTVPDSAIHTVATEIAASIGAGGLAGRIVVHCAAARDRDVLAGLRGTGASVAGLHPLQALSGMESAANLAGSGFALDADPAAVPSLELLVARLGGIVLTLAPDQRAAYHAAAVLAGNA